MQKPNNQPTDLLDQAVQSIQQSVQTVPVPMDLLKKTQFALENEDRNPSLEKPLPKSTTRFRNSWLAIALAASLLLLIGFVVQPWNHNGTAFAAAIKNLHTARSATLRVTQKLGGSPEIHGQMFINEQAVRIEWLEGTLVMIADLQIGKYVSLDTVQKTGQLAKLTDDDVLRSFSNPIEQLRNSKPNDAKYVGQESFNGRITDVFHVKNGEWLGASGIPILKVWIDRELELPCKIVMVDNDPKSEMYLAFDDIQWNVEIPPAKFAISLPSDYKAVEIPQINPSRLEPSNAPEKVGSVLLSSDRVPRSIDWNVKRNVLSAIVSDPENTPVQKVRSNELRQWDIATSKKLDSRSVQGAATLAGSSDGQFLAFAQGREIQILSSSDGSLHKLLVSKHALPWLAINASGKYLAATSVDWEAVKTQRIAQSSIEIWNLSSGEKVLDLSDDLRSDFIAVSPSGDSFATAGGDSGTIQLRRLSDGELLHQFDGHLRAAYSPDGTRLAVVSYRKTENGTSASVSLYDLEDYKMLQTLPCEGEKSTILALTFSRNGDKLAVGSWSGNVRVWSLEKPEGVPQGNNPLAINMNSGIHSVAFSPDGSQLAAGSEDGGLRIIGVK